MGLVCSGKCGQDAVGPEPDAQPPRRPASGKGARVTPLDDEAAAKGLAEGAGRGARSDRDSRDAEELQQAQQEYRKEEASDSEDTQPLMPTKTLLVQEAAAGGEPLAPHAHGEYPRPRRLLRPRSP